MAYLDTQYAFYRSGAITEQLFFGRLRLVFIRITRGDEDIAGDAVLQIWREVRNGKTWTMFSAYANRVVRNALIDEARKDAPLAPAPDSRTAGKKTLVGKRRSRQTPSRAPAKELADILLFLKANPDPVMSQIVADVQRGYTYAENGLLRGMSTAAVKMRISRFRGEINK